MLATLRYSATVLAPEEPDPDPLVQMNVRVRRSKRDRIDTRRAQLVDPETGRAMSRDRWVSNAVEFALRSTPAATPTRNSVRRTAPPPRHRTS